MDRAPPRGELVLAALEVPPGRPRETACSRDDLQSPTPKLSVIAKTYNPWYYKSSDVDIFSEKDATWRRPLGADGHFYCRQLEGFADTILDAAPMRGADIIDGVASVRAMVAIAESVRSNRAVRLADVKGPI